EGGRPGRGTPRGDARGGTPPGTGRIQPRNDRVRTGRPAGGPDGRGRRHMGGPGRGQCPYRPPVAPAQPTDLAHPVGVGPDPAAAEGTPGRSFCRRDQRYGAGTGRGSSPETSTRPPCTPGTRGVPVARAIPGDAGDPGTAHGAGRDRACRHTTDRGGL